MESYLLLALYDFYHPMLLFKISSGHVKHEQLFYYIYLSIFVCVCVGGVNVCHNVWMDVR